MVNTFNLAEPSEDTEEGKSPIAIMNGWKLYSFIDIGDGRRHTSIEREFYEIGENEDPLVPTCSSDGDELHGYVSGSPVIDIKGATYQKISDAMAREFGTALPPLEDVRKVLGEYLSRTTQKHMSSWH